MPKHADAVRHIFGSLLQKIVGIDGICADDFVRGDTDAAGCLGAVEIARSERARQFYAGAWEVAADPRPRQKAARLVREAAAKFKR